MGINFYVRYNACECCNRYDEHHVGKSSVGWKFTFQGPVYEGEVLTIGEDEVPVPKTREEWNSIFNRNDVTIWDEAGNRVHRISLVARIESRQEEQSHAILFPKQNWEDEEGYAFSGREFE